MFLIVITWYVQKVWAFCRVWGIRQDLYALSLDILGTVMVEHVLKICEKDGNFDNIYL